jgi:hypothetical protein
LFIGLLLNQRSLLCEGEREGGRERMGEGEALLVVLKPRSCQRGQSGLNYGAISNGLV